MPGCGGSSRSPKPSRSTSETHRGRERDLRTEGDFTIVLFAHRGWREPVECMHHCSTKWASFLLSLKAFLETGTGATAPHDVKISDRH
jgi:hypothetical protein